MLLNNNEPIKVLEPRDFVKKFLPDYDAKRITFENECWTENKYEFGFISKHFGEAIQNYTNLICAMQRENCSSNAEIVYDGGSCENPYPVIDRNSVTHSEQPSMERVLISTNSNE
jgi:hypothetical protein